MPARKKPPSTQQDRRPQRSRVDLVVVKPTTDEPIPSPPVVPGGLLVDTRRAWAAYWRSDVAKATAGADAHVAERWILAYDEWRRALAAVRRKRVVEGSTGQPVLNPLAAWVASREAEMERCAKQLGIGTKARIDLGISVGQARLTAAELNKMTEESGDDAVIDDEEAQLLEEFEQAT